MDSKKTRSVCVNINDNIPISMRPSGEYDKASCIALLIENGVNTREMLSLISSLPCWMRYSVPPISTARDDNSVPVMSKIEVTLSIFLT
jgi:hypothetical protein